MDNGNLTANTAATLALLADTARAGRGGYGGYFGGEGGGYFGGPFASPSSNAVRIQEGNRQTAAGIENLLDQNQFSATNDNIVQGHNRICDSVNAADIRNADRFTGLNKDVTDSEFRAIARENALRAEMAANNLASIERDHRAEIKAAECCCELKAEIAASESRAIERSLNAANAELTALKTQIACGCCPPQG